MRTQMAVTARPADARGFERTMAVRREVQHQQDGLLTFAAQNSRSAAINESDARVEAMRRMRTLQVQNAELQQAYTLDAQLREKQQRAMLAEQDEQLAAAMAHLKSEEAAREQSHRRICDESEELSELRALLKAAEMNKARATQLSEKQLIQEQHRAREEHIAREMELDRQAGLALEQADLERRQLINMQSRNVLQSQMADKERQKQLAYEQFLKEKAVIDNIVASIAADDAAKLKMQLDKQRELQANIRTYLDERAAWRAEEKKRAEYELKKIHEYQQLQEQRHEELMRARQTKADRQDKLLEKITAEMEAARRAEEEMQQLLYELYAEEAESKALKEIQAREAKIALMRREMIEANEYQKAFKAQRRLTQQREEEEFRAKMLEKFANDQRLEAANVARRRRETEAYRHEVEQMVQERKAIYEQAVEAELAERRAAQQELEHRLAIVEEERQRLLRDYARDLKDYLPKGVFRTDADFERVFERKPERAAVAAKPNATSALHAPPAQLSQENARKNQQTNIKFR